MKHYIFISLAVLTFIVSTPRAHALFGHVAAEKERRQEAEQQFTQERRTNDHLHIIVSVLSAGVTVVLIIGAAVGSKARRDA